MKFKCNVFSVRNEWFHIAMGNFINIDTLCVERETHTEALFSSCDHKKIVECNRELNSLLLTLINLNRLLININLFMSPYLEIEKTEVFLSGNEKKLDDKKLV